MYVADTNQIESRNLAPVAPISINGGVMEANDGQFNEPSGIAVDTEGYVYVADTIK